MNKEIILEFLRNDIQNLRQHFGVESIGLFGSYSKGLQTDDSDIDFLVKLKPPYASNFFGLWNYLEKKLNKKIDLTREGAHLRSNFINTINKEIIYA